MNGVYVLKSGLNPVLSEPVFTHARVAKAIKHFNLNLTALN